MVFNLNTHPLRAYCKMVERIKKIPLIYRDSSPLIVMKIFIKDEDRD
ncbi:MAG: hypothetical protein H5T39_00835 [Methanobacteriales archaeon]|nr:hypothetical protein [Methanobacteriales archaeon]